MVVVVVADGSSAAYPLLLPLKPKTVVSVPPTFAQPAVPAENDPFASCVGDAVGWGVGVAVGVAVAVGVGVSVGVAVTVAVGEGEGVGEGVGVAVGVGAGANSTVTLSTWNTAPPPAACPSTNTRT